MNRQERIKGLQWLFFFLPHQMCVMLLIVTKTLFKNQAQDVIPVSVKRPFPVLHHFHTAGTISTFTLSAITTTSCTLV